MPERDTGALDGARCLGVPLRPHMTKVADSVVLGPLQRPPRRPAACHSLQDPHSQGLCSMQLRCCASSPLQAPHLLFSLVGRRVIRSTSPKCSRKKHSSQASLARVRRSCPFTHGRPLTPHPRGAAERWAAAKMSVPNTALLCLLSSSVAGRQRSINGRVSGDWVMTQLGFTIVSWCKASTACSSSVSRAHSCPAGYHMA